MKKQDLYARITSHGENLKVLFGLDPATDPVALCKALRRLETQAHRLTTAYANGDVYEQACDIACDKILVKLDALLGFKAKGLPVFVNTDPRGYALKINLDRENLKCSRLYRDMGGYGILAPDLRD